MRRGRYVKGKKVGKANVINVVSHGRSRSLPVMCSLNGPLQHVHVMESYKGFGAVLQGDEVKKGQALGFIEQLGTYVPVEVRQQGSWLVGTTVGRLDMKGISLI